MNTLPYRPTIWRGYMATRTFYNDNDPFMVRWLRQLVTHGYISRGIVDDRPIQDIPEDFIPKDHFVRCHFFAGIAGWDLALRIAGWPPDAPVWTGSPPCQPFSRAGKRSGAKDSRHLWPHFRALIEKHRPPICFGEQVGGPLGREWLARVRSDMESLGYAVGAADLPAAGVAAPHLRQRLFWVADDGTDSPWNYPIGERSYQGVPVAVGGEGGDSSRGIPYPYSGGRGPHFAGLHERESDPVRSGERDEAVADGGRRIEGSEGSRNDRGAGGGGSAVHPRGRRGAGGMADGDSERVPASSGPRQERGAPAAGTGEARDETGPGAGGDRAHVGMADSEGRRREQVGEDARGSDLRDREEAGQQRPGRTRDARGMDDAGDDRRAPGNGHGRAQPAEPVGTVPSGADRAVDHSPGTRREGRQRGSREAREARDGARMQQPRGSGEDGRDGRVDDANGERAHEDHLAAESRSDGSYDRVPGQTGAADPVGDADRPGFQEREDVAGSRGEVRQPNGWEAAVPSSPWDRFHVIPCGDGKARRVGPGIRPVASRIPGRVGLLRGYGNSIVPSLAAVFIRAFMEAKR